ncbi:MAG TPA: 4Fe-4S dicluster domain-containing protein [Candidatus Cloacimonetes bacterium]|nr:4Fe-4S dicluster domain-containing protein [Candidatus Cloacimonadota bacterium]HEX37859.1 4Fe-4S dicluster domain-containing protein [Candidatus Cloacimonadota bacterium]
MKRKIISIDEDKCNGCGQCIPNCPEGALQIIDGKARLVSDLFCDGLGECIGHCPEDAISVEEREAEPYNEKKVMDNIIKAGPNTIKAHLKHLKDHGEEEYFNKAVEVLREKDISVPELAHKEKLACGCPSTMAQSLNNQENNKADTSAVSVCSQLNQWPVQLKLVNPYAPYLDNADLLIAADCCAYAYGNFHQKFIKDRITIILCPKLDIGIEQYIEKLALIFKNNTIKSITVARMEVPCCGGIEKIVEAALHQAGRSSMVKLNVISVSGEII